MYLFPQEPDVSNRTASANVSAWVATEVETKNGDKFSGITQPFFAAAAAGVLECAHHVHELAHNCTPTHMQNND